MNVEPENLSVIDAIRLELQRTLQQSKQYQKQIKEAKTHVKKQYYLRKLRKNNKEVMRLLVAHEKLETRRTNKQDDSE